MSSDSDIDDLERVQRAMLEEYSQANWQSAYMSQFPLQNVRRNPDISLEPGAVNWVEDDTVKVPPAQVTEYWQYRNNPLCRFFRWLGLKWRGE